MTFDINLINLSASSCITSVPIISIKSGVIDDEIVYDISDASVLKTFKLDMKAIKVASTHDISPCLAIINKDDSELDAKIFSYNKNTYMFSILAFDRAYAGIYHLKVVP